jgi:cyclase
VSARLPTATTRRSVLGGMAGGVAALMLPRLSRAQSGITQTRLADGLIVLGGAGGNVLAVTTGDGLVLVDTGNAEFSTALLATIGGLSAQGVAAIFNTHWHPDQVGANTALGEAGAAIYAHEKTRIRLRSGYYVPAEDRYVAALPAAGLPTETYYDHGETTIGGRDFEYGYLLEAHTDGDSYVALADANVIAAGDAIAPDRDPVLDWYGGGWLGGRLDALELLLDRSNADTRFVPSYGPVVGRAEVEAEHAMLTTCFERFVERIRLGESSRDMLRAGILDGLGREFDEPFRFVDDAYKGFWGHHNTLMHDIV